MSHAPYRPIACSLHDRLEDLAVRRVRERFLIREADGSVREATERVVDLFAREGAEFVRFSGGEVVRLDRLVAVGAEHA